MEKVKSNLMPVIFNLLAVAVRKARETAHSHSHRQVLPFDVTGADVLLIRRAAQNSSPASARCRAVARFRAFGTLR